MEIIKTKHSNNKQNILIIKVGNESRPATPEEHFARIDKARETIVKSLQKFAK
jgi:hypothetical protein